MKKAANSLTKVGHNRNISVTIDDATAASYIDTSLNFEFRDIYLEESEIIPTRKINTETEKPNLQIEALLEIFRKQNMHER